MFRNTFSKTMLNMTRKSFETKTKMAPNMFNYKPKTNFSSFNGFFTRMRSPLYLYLIGANVAVYLAWNTNIVSKQFLYNHFTLSQYTINRGFYHTFLTYSFSHINFLHMFFNMFTLYFFGRFTELAFGPKVLLHLYIIGALVSAFFIHTSNKQYNTSFPTVGASGATSAILAFFIFKFPFQQILLFFFPVPAWIVGVLIFGQSLMMYDGRGGISGSGHLGGLLGGFIYFMLTKGKL